MYASTATTKIIGFNLMLICLGVAVLPPATSALLHNASTLVSLKSMRPLLGNKTGHPHFWSLIRCFGVDKAFSPNMAAKKRQGRFPYRSS